MQGLQAFPILPLTAFPGWYTIFCLLVALWGTCIGSFLNACIYRIPNGLSTVHPRSFCPVCRTKIAWYDNVPIFSWLLLKGRCRACRTHISPRYSETDVLLGQARKIFKHTEMAHDGLAVDVKPSGAPKTAVLRYIPVITIVSVVRVLTTRVSIKVPVMAIRPFREGSEDLEAD